MLSCQCFLEKAFVYIFKRWGILSQLGVQTYLEMMTGFVCETVDPTTFENDDVKIDFMAKVKLFQTFDYPPIIILLKKEDTKTFHYFVQDFTQNLFTLTKIWDSSFTYLPKNVKITERFSINEIQNENHQLFIFHNRENLSIDKSFENKWTPSTSGGDRLNEKYDINPSFSIKLSGFKLAILSIPFRKNTEIPLLGIDHWIQTENKFKNTKSQTRSFKANSLYTEGRAILFTEFNVTEKNYLTVSTFEPIKCDLNFKLEIMHFKVSSKDENTLSSFSTRQRPKVDKIKTFKSYKEPGLFKDPEFPITKVLGDKLGNDIGFSINLEWKRPHEIIENPCLIARDSKGLKISHFDVNQGSAGNCWMIAVLIGLAWPSNKFSDGKKKRGILEKLVNLENNHLHSSRLYTGEFIFNFYEYGIDPIEISIDDRLATYASGENKNELKFTKSNDKTEYWTALVEKAYAKLHGSYSNLISGVTTTAIEDIFGGYGHKIPLIEDYIDNPKILHDQIVRALKTDAIITAVIDSSIDSEVTRGNGLIEGHAYGIAGIRDFENTKTGIISYLVEVKNPWGHTEWNGKFSDNDYENWNIGERGSIGEDGLITEFDTIKRYRSKIRNRFIGKKNSDESGMEFSGGNDGHWMMEIGDFIREFRQVEIGFLTLGDYISCYQYGVIKERSLISGAWTSSSSGGCRNYRKTTYLDNPLYAFRPNCKFLLLRLIQKSPLQSLKFINFDVYNLDSENFEVTVALKPKLVKKNKLPATFIKKLMNYKITSSVLSDSRSIMMMVDLQACSTVLVIPSTRYQYEEAEFYLEIVSIK